VEDQDCPTLPGEPARGASFTFALTRWDGIQVAFAPIPRNDSEAIVFRLAYETLVDLDCEGQLVPKLAKKFEFSKDLGVWRFELSADTEYSTGQFLTAAAVKRAWVRSRQNAGLTARLLRHTPAVRNFWFWKEIRKPTIHTWGDTLLFVDAPEAGSDLPVLLSQPAFSIVHPRARRNRGWPTSTRGSLEGTRDSGGEISLVWRKDRSDRAVKPDSITFRILHEADPRDLVQSGVDAFFVRDREAVRYLRHVDGFRVTPFPWSRLYLLLVPDKGFLAELALDPLDLAQGTAVSDARPALSRLQFDRGRRDGGRSRGSARIVFPLGDPDARALAARIASLAARGEGGSTALAVELAWPSEFLEALAQGEDAAYVLPVFPRLPSEHLLRLQLFRSAPWLEEHGDAVALIETRGHLVTRNRLSGIYSGFDGIPRLDQAGWDRGGAWP
jgi:hypothetical protein